MAAQYTIDQPDGKTIILQSSDYDMEIVISQLLTSELQTIKMYINN